MVVVLGNVGKVISTSNLYRITGMPYLFTNSDTGYAIICHDPVISGSWQLDVKCGHAHSQLVRSTGCQPSWGMDLAQGVFIYSIFIVPLSMKH